MGTGTYHAGVWKVGGKKVAISGPKDTGKVVATKSDRGSTTNKKVAAAEAKTKSLQRRAEATGSGTIAIEAKKAAEEEARIKSTAGKTVLKTVDRKIPLGVVEKEGYYYATGRPSISPVPIPPTEVTPEQKIERASMVSLGEIAPWHPLATPKGPRATPSLSEYRYIPGKKFIAPYYLPAGPLLGAELTYPTAEHGAGIYTAREEMGVKKEKIEPIKRRGIQARVVGLFEKRERAFEEAGIELERRRLAGRPARGAQFAVGLGFAGFQTFKGLTSPIVHPVQTVKGLGRLVRHPILSVKELGVAFKEKPVETTFQTAGVLLFSKGAGAAVSKGARLARVGVTRISPKFRPVKTTVLGEQIIAGKQPIGLIPPGKTPKLPVKPLKAVREVRIPRAVEPKIPKLTPAQQKVLAVARERGAVITGSLAERVLVRPRKFADIDVLIRKPGSVATEVAKRIGQGVKVRPVTIKTPKGRFQISRIIEKRTGKVIADIDPLKFGEEAFARRFPTVKVEGVKFISPEARLAAKIEQFGRGKRTAKVLRDIERLTGGKIRAREAARKPLVRGAFGFTKAEQARFIGVKGTVATSARDLFKTFKKTVEIKPEKPLFATPPEVTKGLVRAQTRISRLAIEPTRRATILDILKGDVAFRRPKPQIVLFQDVTVGKQFRPFGLPGPVSTELEVARQAGRIRKIKTVGVTLIKGERVPIITAKLLEPKVPPTKGLIGRLPPVRPRVRAPLPKARDLSMISERVIPKPVVSPADILLKGTLITRRIRKPPRVMISVPPISRAIVRPSRLPLPSRLPSRIISRPPSIPPSRIISRPPKRLPSRVPSMPPSRPPSIPPSRIPSLLPSRLPSVPPSRPPIVPPRVPTPPPAIVIPEPRKRIRPRKKKPKKYKARRPTRYQPSLTAIIPKEEIFGKKPGVLTGIEVRPIPAERMLRGIM